MGQRPLGYLAGDPASTAEFQVGYAVWALSALLSELFKMRMDNRTADQVLMSEGDLLACKGTLDVLIQDIRASNDKMAAE